MAITISSALNPDWTVSPVGDHNSKRRVKRGKYYGDLAGRHETDLTYKKERKPTLAE